MSANGMAKMVERQVSGGRRRILVVDDEEILLEMTREVLHHAGHDVVSAASGEEALDRLNHEEFDLVITDQNMPGIAGLELLAIVRARAPRMPVILMTAYRDQEVTRQVREFEVSACLLKPLDDIDVLVREVHKLMAEGERA